MASADKPEFHILLNARPEWATPVRGKPKEFPEHLRGISGCGVWIIGDTSRAPAVWPKTKRIAGIQTSIYPERAALQVTRFAAVTTLINAAFPDLREAIQRWVRSETTDEG